MSSEVMLRHRQPQCLGLEGYPHDAQLLEVLGGHRRDAHATVRLPLDQALALQHPQRLTQRRAADAELLGKPDLRHHRPRRQVAVEDRSANPLVDVFGVLTVLRQLGSSSS